jgi:hypothetical protein
VEDAVLGLPGGKAEDDAEEAVAAMVDSFLSVGSRAAEEEEEDDDVAARAFATDEWTASPSPSLVSGRSHTGEGMAGSDSATAPFASTGVDPDADPEATETSADDEKKTRAPSSPGGGRVLDFHFGAPFPSARGENHSSASVSEEMRVRRTTSSPVEPNNDLASNIGRFAAGFAATAARARASMRKDAASVHEGVRRGGVKGGLDVAKSIAARAAKELKH